VYPVSETAVHRGCPVGVDIPEFIKALHDGNMAESVKALKRKNALPGICGRVCPQETQCETVCTLEKQRAPVAIGRLERYVADWERAHPKRPKGHLFRRHRVGRSPWSVPARQPHRRADLAKAGHSVTMFEALHVAGGVLVYGIPEFRLPKEIVRNEVNYVTSLGVELRLDAVIGKVETVDELLADGYDAVFLGTGAGLPMFLGVRVRTWAASTRPMNS